MSLVRLCFLIMGCLYWLDLAAQVPLPDSSDENCGSQLSGESIGLDPQKYFDDQMAKHLTFKWASRSEGKWWILRDAKANREVGSIMFNVFGTTPGVLEIESIGLNEGYLGQKLSYLLMAKALIETPGTREISAHLGGANHEAFFRELKGGDVKAAIRKTNAYKIRAKFGFGQITKVELKKRSADGEYYSVSFVAVRTDLTKPERTRSSH